MWAARMFSLSFLGVTAALRKLLTVSALTRVGGPCHVQSRGVALTSPRARSWAGANLWSRFTNLRISISVKRLRPLSPTLLPP